ncbi:T-cell ecto-ADP-ribosyltransferase 1-like [Kryptolebias marmoratus]|uniref:T-cell ecto-ADP-ribosyltransferase 1-like n=1 Tax=Kryptolebias marmoratus TaxID=37003 RepID=UPI0007F90B7A|nr:T-cell ecto-ADP-ribosyltransferase 1-like [Kryptolebias marmoratus]
MLIFTPLCFHLCWMLTMDLMLITCSARTIQLNMVEDSVDDMYDGCRDTMKTILDQNFTSEQSFDDWTASKNCANSKLDEIHPEDMALTKDHLQAICMYTANSYKDINDNVREQRPNYGGLFKFHTLHFFLTTAIQILNPNGQCYTSYRRTPDNYEGQINQRIRFGYFASSSNDSDLTQFGQKTCFKIRTCLGADLKHYSTFDEAENEILIPPYETFTIKKKILKSEKPDGLGDCQLVYVLEHAGSKSNLNCKLIEKFQGPSRAHG